MASSATLRDYQEEALLKMKNGCILNGGTGSGKSRTALAYYYTQNGGKVNTPNYIKMINPQDLYIITTATKRDALEWEGELSNFRLSTNPEYNLYKNKIVVDSWNDIKKYQEISTAMFLFDEQHVTGYGAWTQAFLKIAKKNNWIILSATPGDTWLDYMPVFIANGFYRNKTDFVNQHVIYARYVKFPRVERYFDEGKLIKLRNSILVHMDFERQTIPHHLTVWANYDNTMYNTVAHDRWDPFNVHPIENASEYCFALRRVVNGDPSRAKIVYDIVQERKKAIIFYSYNYELDDLKKIFKDYPMGERNGKKHDNLPTGDRWVYLVQYTSGSEAWNCITADTVIFYSQSYSYRAMVQAAGRIDRVNTKYIDLYYYHIKTTSKIDSAIHQALTRKQKFNEAKFAPEFKKPEKKEEKEHDWLDDCESHNSWSNPLT